MEEIVASFAMNLELLDPAIAPHSSGTHQWCASRPVRLIRGLFAMPPLLCCVYARSAGGLTQFVWEPGDLDPAGCIHVRGGTIAIYLDLPTGPCGGEIAKRSSESG
jgi:hypothetical protein